MKATPESVADGMRKTLGSLVVLGKRADDSDTRIRAAAVAHSKHLDGQVGAMRSAAVGEVGARTAANPIGDYENILLERERCERLQAQP